MAEWRDRFRALVSEIENHPMLVVTSSEIREPASSERIERPTQNAGGGSFLKEWPRSTERWTA
jgi:hypothetical protein